LTLCAALSTGSAHLGTAATTGSLLGPQEEHSQYQALTTTLERARDQVEQLAQDLVEPYASRRRP